MNVKIKVTVPIKKVPAKIAELLEEASNELQELSSNIKTVSEDLIHEKDFLLQLEKIDSFRRNLSFLDARLEDCYDVLDGLVKYKTNADKEIKNVEQPPN